MLFSSPNWYTCLERWPNSPDLKIFFQNHFQQIQNPPEYYLMILHTFLDVSCTMSLSSEIFCKPLFNQEPFFYNIFCIAQGIQNLNITWVAEKINTLLHTDPDQQTKMPSKNLKQESCTRQRNLSTYQCVHLEHNRESLKKQPTLMHLQLEKSGSYIRIVKWFSCLELERKT